MTGVREHRCTVADAHGPALWALDFSVAGGLGHGRWLVDPLGTFERRVAR